MPPRAKSDAPKSHIYSDVSGMSVLDATPLNAERSRLQASLRPDMGGAPLDLLQHPLTYQDKVVRMWEGYNTDPLFHRLIDRVCDFVANGAEWEIGSGNEKGSWLKKLWNWSNGSMAAIEREENFWNAWALSLNKGVPNVLPGLNEVTRWAAKHLLLSGMFIPHWEYDAFTFGKQSFTMPVRMTCYPASQVMLKRDNKLFMEEQIFMMRTSNPTMQEGYLLQAPQQTSGGVPNKNLMSLPIMDATTAKVGSDEGFALKMNWSPGDLSTIAQGRRRQTGFGVYPSPPFFSLLPQLAIRQKLFAADLALLDGIINYIMLYKIGTKEHPPTEPKLDTQGNVLKRGTISIIKDAIQAGRVGPAMELFVPFYVDLAIMTPEPAVLLSEQKYAASTSEILQAFSIFTARTMSGRGEKMEKINISSFEEFLANLRFHIKAFLQLLAEHCVKINAGKLTVVPNWSPNLLNTKSELFMQRILELAKIGSVSFKTLLRAHSLDDEAELRRIAAELATDVDDVKNANVPTSYVQQTVTPDPGGEDPNTPSPRARQPVGDPLTNPADPSGKSRKQIKVTPGMQQGRPKGKVAASLEGIPPVVINKLSRAAKKELARRKAKKK